MSPETAARNARIAAECVEIRVGDTWSAGVFLDAVVTITAIVAQDGLSWPRVAFMWPSGRQDSYGAPAFRMARLVKRGTGEGWKPGDPPIP